MVSETVLCCLCGRGKAKSGQKGAGNPVKVSVVHGAKFYVVELLYTHRDEQLSALQSGKEYDVLVIGGGVTGCGVALDSTLRGQ